MLPEWLPFLLLVAFGGWVAIDGTSFGQFMISRPVVAASVAGWIVGAPVQGVTLGLLLEALHLPVLPVGASRYPEAGPAAVAAAGVYAAGPPGAAGLLMAVLFALGWERLAGEATARLRQLNAALVAPADGSPIAAHEIERRHLGAIALDLARGALLVAVGMLLLAGLLAILVPLWRAGEWLPRVALAATLVMALAGSFHLFAAGRSLRLALVGAACGLLFVALR